MRGVLTDKIKEISKKMIGREIDRTELRLAAYAQYVMTNNQKLDPNCVTQEERVILREWRDAGFMEGGASGMAIAKEFWDFICEIIFEGYVVGGAELCQ